MKFGEMLGFTNRYKEIIKSKLPEKNKTMRLSYLMSDLEEAYSIPMLKNEQFEKAHPQLMQLYRTVSDAREF
ncbi:MAG: hypothetical protein R3267_05995 [Paenisporosarcina sp.]|nr:hypothetical protein [Paenisporosarcina sp.]